MRIFAPSRVLVSLWCAFAGLLVASSATAAITWNKVYTGFSSPVEITQADDGSGRLFVVEQSGKIRIIKNGAVLATPFVDLGASGSDVIVSGGERGLLGLAFHPQYATNRQFYVNYTRKLDGATVIARYTAAVGTPDVANPGGSVLLVIAQPEGNHNGGAVKFGSDGYLYIGMGDGGGANDQHGTIGNAQDKNSLLGKILRIDVDNGSPYAIPPGNPYAVSGGAKEIFAIGVRNPWRMSFDRATGDFWFGDVGQGAVEEVDLLPAGTGAGANLGWRILEGNSCTGLTPPASLCSDPTLKAPVITYTHSVGCSITGGYVYRGAAVPALAGQYLYADYCSGRIWAAQKIGNGPWTPTELGATGYNVSTFGEDEAGELYFANYSNGDIYRFADSGSPPLLSVSAASLTFGNIVLGTSSLTQTFNITNAGGATLTLTTLSPGGLNPGDFTRAGTCMNGSALTASQSCTVIYQFTPAQVGPRSATLSIASSAGNATVTLAGNGVAVAAPVLSVSATAISFGTVTIGSSSAGQTFTVTNAGTGMLTLSTLTGGGLNPGDFIRTGTCANGTNLVAAQICTVTYTFTPTAAGMRAASLAITTSAGNASVTLDGTGNTSVPDVVTVVEYYHAGFDHYFITSLSREIVALDTGQFLGWARTQKSFKAWAALHAGTDAVCRFYLPPAQGDSHFFSASPVECNDALVRFPTFVYESPAVMYEFLPDEVTGACPSNTVPIYRVWNQRVDSNHRYTTDRALRDAMVGRGYVAEGYGPDAVVMCGPQ